MKLNRIVLSLLIICTTQLSAQTIEGFEDQAVESYQSKVKDQVRFLEYLLNTIGSEDASNRDKDVIITESYLKIFRDSKVQIEDDLTENRQVLINKDITAYLKDIDFFFQDASFDFEIVAAEPFLRDNGELSFKVEINRTLKATGIEGESILNTQKRFIEINLDEESDELQIVSIYTTKVSRDEAIEDWWENLSLAWKTLFKEKLGLDEDSVELEQLYKIVSIDSLDLSGNELISNLSPLGFLVDLRYINLENTRTGDISPLSSLTELHYLNLSRTYVEDLSFLRYAENMEFLNISYTPVQKIEDLKNLLDLKELNLKGADVRNFTVLRNFKNIQSLDLSETFFDDPELFSDMDSLLVLNVGRSNLSKLTKEISPHTLKQLDVSFAFISDLTPLADYQRLEILNINNTQVEDLLPLEGLPNLKKIYADNTFVSEDDINDFVDENPEKLVVVNSEEISQWWSNLNKEWKAALEIQMDGRLVDKPKKEDLSKLLLKDSLNLNNWALEDLTPLKKFSRLRYLSISDNPISNLQPIEGLNALNTLEAENLNINSIQSLLQLKKLKRLNLSQNQLSSEQFLSLIELTNLEEIVVDRSGIKKEVVAEFFAQGSTESSVIFDVSGMRNWWIGLNDTWQMIFKVQFPMGRKPTDKELHELVAIKSIVIVNEEIESLRPLSQFIALDRVNFEKVGIDDLQSISAIREISEFSFTNSSISDFEPLNQLYDLEKLVLDFTAVSDLRPLETMQNLKHLSVRGTQVKNLKGIEDLVSLNYLNISSTQVRWIGKLKELSNLEQFVCFNTNIFDFSLNKFKEDHVDCQIRFY